MLRYAFWPTGDFCPLEDVDQYTHFMSDDYETKDFEDDDAALGYIDRVVFSNKFAHPQVT